MVPKTSNKKFTKRSLPIYAAAALGLALFAVAVFRAASSGMTYDEAYTYVNYAVDLRLGKIPDMFFNSYANNHWLNTLLIKLLQGVTRVYYNELLIRLPSLLSFAAFLGLAVYLLAKREIGFGGFALLALSYYLDEFFGLARGYAMATSLVLLSLCFYLRWQRGPAERFMPLTLCLASLALSTLALTLTLLVFIAVGLAVLARLLRERQLWSYLRRQWGALLPICALTLLMVWYHFNSTGGGKPLPDNPPSFYAAFAEGFLSLYLPSGGLPQTAALLLCAGFIAVLALFWKKILRSSFVLPLLLHLLIWLGVRMVTGLYPNQRGLLVSLPLFVLALCEMGGWCGSWWRRRFARQPRLGALAILPNLLLVAALLAAYIPSVDLYTTQAWRGDYEIRDTAYEFYKYREEVDEELALEPYPMKFYRGKILHETDFDIYPLWQW